MALNKSGASRDRIGYDAVKAVMVVEKKVALGVYQGKQVPHGVPYIMIEWLITNVTLGTILPGTIM